MNIKDVKQLYINFYLYLGPYSPTFQPVTMEGGKFINLSNFKEISINMVLNYKKPNIASTYLLFYMPSKTVKETKASTSEIVATKTPTKPKAIGIL